MPHRGRMLLGFAVVPFAASLFTLAADELLWHAGLLPDGFPIHSIDAAQALFAGALIIAMPMTLIGTVPGVLWLQRKRWLTFSRLVALGAVVGNMPFVLTVISVVITQLVSGTPVTEIERSWGGGSGLLGRVAMGVMAGAGSAAAFWLVALCGTSGQAIRSWRPVNAP